MTPKTAIILPCHSIWKFYTNTSPTSPGENADEWSLASFQLVSQDQLTFMKHLQHSIELLNNDPNSVLIITGGATKSDTGPVTEAQSYYYLGLQLGIINDQNKTRVHLENYARDSMENLLFGIARFSQIYHGEVPKQYKVVGMEFKRRRFVSNHAEFLNIANTLEYIGFDPQVSEKNTGDNDFYASEIKHAVTHFEKDPCGIKSPLKNKKLSRDPYHNGGELNYLGACNAAAISLQELSNDENLTKYYNLEEIEDNQDILKIYKFIQISH